MSRPVHRAQISFSLGLILFPILAADAAGGQDDLDTAVAGHLATVQKIHSLSCRLIIAPASSGLQTPISGQYWRSGRDVRVKYELAGRKVEAAVQKSVFTQLYPPDAGHKMPRAFIRNGDDSRVGDLDAWMYALFAFAGPDQTAPLVTLDRLLSKPHELLDARQISSSGKNLVYTRMRHALSELEFWFDPNVNYLVRKHSVSTLTQPTAIRTVFEVAKFEEIVPGIFFPVEVRLSHMIEGKPFFDQTATFSHVEVNKFIPSDRLRLTIPAGAEVSDQIRNRLYRMDADGRPAGDDKEIQDYHSPSKDVKPYEPTRQRDWGISAWLAALSLGILLISASLRLRKRANTGVVE